jgi:CDP-paratose 2-epimerase
MVIRFGDRANHAEAVRSGAGRANWGLRAFVLVTGGTSAWPHSSEAAAFFDQRGWEVHGVDNNMRRDFFGADGDTTWNLERLRRITKRFTHYPLDVRDAKDRPFDDFDVNAGGALNLLEAVRHSCPDSPSCS